MSRSKGAAAAVPEARPVPAGVSIANHPRARTWIRRSRARVGLAAFALVLLVALNAGVPAEHAVLRALAAGIAGFLCTWAIGVALWKQLVMAELRSAYERRERRRRELVEAAAERERARREAQASGAGARM